MNIDKFRADTPGCRQLAHLNNAGSALPPQQVLDTVLDYLRLEASIGGYEAEREKAAELEGVYGSLARLLNSKPNEIAITQNATRAWSMVFYGLPLTAGDRILTCRAEYASNFIAFLQRARATGAEIVVVDNDADGALCLESLDRLLDERVKLVAINHVPTNGGLVQPAAEVGRLLKDHPAIYLLDACQSVGQMPIDVEQIGCDVLSATSRKFLRGPRGLGFLYVREALIAKLEPAMLDLHAATWDRADHYRLRDDARRFETYETFVGGRLGLAAAAEYAMAAGQQECWERARALAAMAREGLREMGALVHDLGREQGAIVTFTLPGHETDQIAAFLRGEGINVWTCTANSARLDMEARGLSKLVRVSPHYYNSEDEIGRFAGTLKRYLG